MAKKTYKLDIPNEKDVRPIKKLLKAAGLIEISPNHFIEKPKPVKKKTSIRSKPAVKRRAKPKNESVEKPTT